MKKSTTRVQLELPPNSMERLGKLKEISEAASYAEVVKSALRLYEGLLFEMKSGSEFEIVKKDGERKLLRMFL
ncbi:MAG: hypothetical protein GKR98_01770 [Boseongicola sp.]|nr:MAG: hypothetical protein GKR98_01770 [Boseongicola sp.]